MKSKGSDLPIEAMLSAHLKKEKISFHMPGHKGRGEGEASYDVTELSDTDCLFDPKEGILKAQRLAAEAFGADETFFLVGGSTAGILAMLGAAAGNGDTLIVDRNCHASVVHGLILHGITPVFVSAGTVGGLFGGLTPRAVEQKIIEHPSAKGVLLTSPTYYGLSADVKGIAEVVHRYGKLLMVDEAHGAHYGFSSLLPRTAISSGADMAVQSAHKTLNALTGSAYLHIKGERVSPARVMEMLRMVETSSPSYLMMRSLDKARDEMQNEGEQKLQALYEALTEGLPPYENAAAKMVGKAGVMAYDFTRLLIDVSGTGRSGFEVSEALYSKYGISLEMADQRYLVALLTVHNTPDEIVAFKKALSDLGVDPRAGDLEIGEGLKEPELKMSLREAFYSPCRLVSPKKAIGKVAARAVSAFPPCVPLLVPGEVIREDVLLKILQYKQEKSEILGLVDGKVPVLAF